MKQWQRQEKDLEKGAARCTPASGAGFRKGDALTDHFCIQAKSTQKNSISLKLSDVSKAVSDAMTEERIPVIQYEISHGTNRFALLRWKDFQALCEEAGLEI